VYLRESRRRNKDGTVVSYLQLAHNERHPVTSPVAKVIHNFGWANNVDRAVLARLMASISRFLEPGQAAAAAAGSEVEILDSRRMDGAWVLDRIWERLEIGAAIGKVFAGRRLDGQAAERIIFALAAAGTTSTPRSSGAPTPRPLRRWPGRYHTVVGNLRGKEVWVPAKGAGERAERFTVCHNPEQALRDKLGRGRLVTHLEDLIAVSDTWPKRRRDELVGSFKDKPGLRRFLRSTPAGLLRIDKTAIKAEAGLDGKWLLRTNGQAPTPDDLAATCKQLVAVERAGAI
jgi:hypothetical protein